MKTLTQTKTHIAKVRQSNANVITRVCDLLGWTIERYCEYQFDNYIQFIEALFAGCPEEMSNEVKFSPVFRGFWNNEAFYRNSNLFLPFAQDEPEGSPEILAEFLYIHNPEYLMNDDDFMEHYNYTLKTIRKEQK
ncbi:Uncharacterised protein [Sphingobacterium spiritivorum]|uniref:Uncharacterized protein n=1 Tax=Sphingobacterium spiritivorum TaxID=258 RepID=A0A380CQ68_SPHSI|nr:hypothetical protein [Sphingobacterium spiritivorum]SUJ26382.1 Uncharacterised protein [Sphingobacterium spiritivorum]